jgi:hypothetical protein
VTSDNLGDEPVPQTDPTPAEGPGGPDAVPDWEAAGPDPVTPDQPRSAQVQDKDMPDELSEPEAMDESDGAGSHPGDEEKDPAEEGKETLTEPGDNKDQPTTST